MGFDHCESTTVNRPVVHRPVVHRPVAIRPVVSGVSDRLVHSVTTNCVHTAQSPPQNGGSSESWCWMWAANVGSIAVHRHSQTALRCAADSNAVGICIVPRVLSEVVGPAQGATSQFLLFGVSALHQCGVVGAVRVAVGPVQAVAVERLLVSVGPKVGCRPTASLFAGRWALLRPGG